MNQEMDNLNQKMDEMREEIKVFQDIEALKSRAEHEKKIYKARHKTLKKRRDALKQALKIHDFEKKKRLSLENEKMAELENELQTMEKKLKALEDNLFLMKEFVAEKGAETNIGPLWEEVRGLGHEINTMLIQMQQKVA